MEETKELIIVENGVATLPKKIAKDFVKAEKCLKDLKKMQDDIKKQIKDAMVKNGIKQIKDDTVGLTITYVEPVEGLEVFDKDKFQSEHSDLFDKYVSFNGKRADSIRVTTK